MVGPGTEIPPIPVGGGIAAVFSSFDKCRSDVDSDVISSAAVDLVGVDVSVNFGASGLKKWPNYSILCRPHPFHVLLCSIYSILQPTRNSAADVISDRFVRLIVPDMWVKFGDPRLNHSVNMRPEAIGDGIFAITADRNELVTLGSLILDQTVLEIYDPLTL